ncbi:MAG: hypothetical protein COB35_00990 [Gammaproteobacteria bacterium]|nr:MAG: hypothetical protein COB35_00990 [Gammaproteobacteria bacterium]
MTNKSTETTKKFRSLRKKLVIKLGITYLLALLFVFVLIIVKNTLDFNATIAESKIRLQSSLTNKGMLLVENNSNALVGLVEDNAFSAVEAIVTKTVQSSQDIVYGIFTDLDKNNWVYAFKNEQLKQFKGLVDANAVWALAQTQAISKDISVDQLQVIEFAAPVLVDGEQLGVIRYGLSTTELTETIAVANKKARQSLWQTLFALIIVGMVTLILVFLRTDKVAKQITIPLNQLTDVANIVASGQYDQTINIQTNDEIGILASNFNLMTNTINRTIADLAKINQVGNDLAKTRNEGRAFQWVLEALLTQLQFQLGLFFCSTDNSALTLRASYPENNLKLNDIETFITNHQKVNCFIHDNLDDDAILTLNITEFTHNGAFKSLVLMPFGCQNNTQIFIALLSDQAEKKVASSELAFCLSIRHLLITSLQNISMNELLAEQNKNLEKTVNQRTDELRVQNEALSNTLAELEQAQNQLVEAEKMASLGSLVAGISHEVNTPLGISVTAASHLNKVTKQFELKFSRGDLTKSGFISYMKTADETTDIILVNLERAATLIQSFKQIAVDQSSDTKTKFDLKQHLEMLICSLRPTYKILPININICGDSVEVNSYPGLLNQIVTNLVMNSIKHGLNECQQGEINIIIKQQDTVVILLIEDDGIGIPDEIKNKVFDPFFTTKRGSGGTGLGLNIVYNLVTQKLAGDIIVEDNQPKGTRFIVSFPVDK